MKLPAPLTRLGIGAAFVLVTLVATFSVGCSETNPGQADVPDSQTRPADAQRVSTPRETPRSAQGSNGVSDGQVLFGQSAAFSGPAQELGTNMRLGIEAAFNDINKVGGVHGRVLKLVTLDDAYEPEAAVTNTLRLIEEENVFALIGEVGYSNIALGNTCRRRRRRTFHSTIYRR